MVWVSVCQAGPPRRLRERRRSSMPMPRKTISAPTIRPMPRTLELLDAGLRAALPVEAVGPG
jgi:hypothetical protein